MTGVTLTLTEEQRRELITYDRDGRPRAPLTRPSRNLLRRGLLASTRTTHGVGTYRITRLGVASLDATGQHLDGEQHLDLDDVPADERFALYVLENLGPRLIATAPDAGGIGAAIFAQDADAREVDTTFPRFGVLGILDRLERRWIVNPYLVFRTVTSAPAGGYPRRAA